MEMYSGLQLSVIVPFACTVHLCSIGERNSLKTAQIEQIPDRIIALLFIRSKAVIKKTQVSERLKVAKAALQWLVIDPNGSSKLYNEREVMGS